MVNKDSSAFILGEKAGRIVGHAIKGFLGTGLVGIVFKYIKKLKKVNRRIKMPFGVVVTFIKEAPQACKDAACGFALDLAKVLVLTLQRLRLCI